MSYFHFPLFMAITILVICMSGNSVQRFNINVNYPMYLEDEQQVFTENVCKLLEFIVRKGYHVTLGEAYRTHEQALIYAKEGLGIKNSLHCERLAIDLNIFTADEKQLTNVEDFRPFGEYWESLHKHNRWGGNFKTRPDADHFEMQDERQ
jgi:hypothetical protein